MVIGLTEYKASSYNLNNNNNNNNNTYSDGRSLLFQSTRLCSPKLRKLLCSDNKVHHKVMKYV